MAGRLCFRAALGAAVLAVVALAGSGGAAGQTQPGFEIGPEAYYYAYREPDFVAQTGAFVAATGSYTYKPGAVFLTGNVIAGVGYLDYTSNGTGRLKGIVNLLAELRALIGADLPLGSSLSLSPYTGLGYRTLYDIAGGRSTSTGAVGYDRISQYFYVPLGLALGIASGDWVLRPSAEYDLFLHGIQLSYLSEVGFDNDVANQQTHGWGARASFLAETATRWGRVSFGPFIRYWNIGNSHTATLFAGGAAVATVFEPANSTIEAGGTLRFHF